MIFILKCQNMGRLFCFVCLSESLDYVISKIKAGFLQAKPTSIRERQHILHSITKVISLVPTRKLHIT